MNKNNKKRLLLLSTLFVLATYHSVDYVYPPRFEIVNSKEDGFAKYSKGRIFVGDKEYIESINDKLDTDIFVEDLRNCDDPNFKIYSSYLIDDKNIRNEILEILCQYEMLFPSMWNRSIESMRLEWLVHNISYYFNYKQPRAVDVDLNNNDENLYDNILLRKLLKL